MHSHALLDLCSLLLLRSHQDSPNDHFNNNINAESGGGELAETIEKER